MIINPFFFLKGESTPTKIETKFDYYNSHLNFDKSYNTIFNHKHTSF